MEDPAGLNEQINWEALRPNLARVHEKERKSNGGKNGGKCAAITAEDYYTIVYVRISKNSPQCARKPN